VPTGETKNYLIILYCNV